MYNYDDQQFIKMIEPYINNSRYQELKNCKHHGIHRYEHSIRVSYYTYKISKMFHLRVEEATIGALLHDFFTDEVKEKNGFERLTLHPIIASQNAKDVFHISSFQEDIIRTHMFPVTLEIPKSIEGWIVDLVDDVASVYERIYSTCFFFYSGFSYSFVSCCRFLGVNFA